MKRELFRPKTLLRLIPLLLLTVAGCGEVDWFPDYVRLPTTPDAFSFTAKTGTEKNVSVTSDAVTVSGLTAASSPISITGSAGSNSKYTINDGTATESAGTVQNGDKVTVTHTSSTALGTSTTSTLTIGAESAQFVSTTRFVDTLTFTTPTVVGSYLQSYADITSVDGAIGTHVISIKDSSNSGAALYAVTERGVVSPDSSIIFTSATQTLPLLNGKRIFVRNLATVVAIPAVTTLTIDGVDTVVSLTPP